ncbi:MAG TPA: hypothetical protein ENK18_16755 [Deltaproteobacteria bacterium]|nr:hypothetical protein [Deltaproteobacteria bacterium]
MVWALSGLISCLSLPSEEGKFDVPLKPNLKLELRERRPLLPSGGPPPPEAGVLPSQCDDLDDGGPVNGPSCITDRISCGDTIIGHTKGGVQLYDTRFWEKKFCWPATVQHDGGDERVYRLDMPRGEWRAFVWLDTPCADLDMMAIKFNDDRCPTIDHSLPRCEAMLKKGARNRERIELVHQGEATWYIVVEGRDDEEGAFALHVQCRPGLQ